MTQAAGEDNWHRAQLQLPAGQPGSGARRYAAAMYFHARGLMPPQMLEIYRRCYRDDREDPVDLARFEGLAPPPVTGR